MKPTFTRIFMILIILILANNYAFSQLITAGSKHTIFSSILDEERELMIYTPKSYDHLNRQQAYYPVIYLLDAESNYLYFTGIIEKLSSGYYPAIPEMIIVGIVNTNRTRDLTPIKAMNSDHQLYQNQETGGNDAFIRFISEELFPYIERSYRTDSFKILVGHSFGGITALNIMLTNPKLFNAYIVHDPSIPWADRVILKMLENIEEGKDFYHRKLFLSLAGEGTRSKIQKNSDTISIVSEHQESIKRFNEILNTKKFKNFSYEYHEYPYEDHGSVTIVGNFDGIRSIFSNFRINIKQIANNPNLINDTFAQLNRESNHHFIPSEDYIERVIDYFTMINDDANTLKYLNYNVKLYPKSAQAAYALALFYKDKNNEKSEYFFRKAAENNYQSDVFFLNK